MDAIAAKDLAFWGALLYSALSTIVLWGFMTGRWSRGVSADVDSLRKAIADLEVTVRQQHNADASNTDRVNASLGQIVNRLALIERDIQMVQELRAEVGMMKTELLQTASKAKHDAINAIDGTMKMLELRKVNADLHGAQIEDIHRRLNALERFAERRDS